MSRRGIHSSLSDLVVLSPITPLTSGGSLDLANGQVGLLLNKPSARGLQAVSSLSGLKGKRKLHIEVGTGVTSSAGGLTPKGIRSSGFYPEDVLEVTRSYAKPSTLHELIIGYDGFNPNKTISLKPDESAQISLRLTGAPIAFYGFKDGIIELAFGLTQPSVDSCVDDCAKGICKDVVLEVVDKMRNHQLREGIYLKDLIDIHPILSCYTDLTPTIDANFFTLEVVDAGDVNALGQVQSQYAGYPVQRTKRDNTSMTSTYTIIITDESTPDDFVNYAANLKPDCETCPDGYTLVDGGFLYSVSLEDEATDQTALVETLANAVATTAIKVGQYFGVGTYQVVLSEPLSDEDLATFLGAGAIQATAQLEEISEVESVCVADESTTIAWVAGDTCQIAETTYTIELADTNCGDSRLLELQAAFPDYAVTELEDPAPAACRRAYEATVVSNIVCDECHPDIFRFEAPSDFEFEKWKASEIDDPADDADCKCGIKFRGKDLKLCPEACIADTIGTVNGQISIEVSGGERIGDLIGYSYNEDKYPVTIISRAFNGTGWGEEFISREKQTYDRYLSFSAGKDFAERWFKGSSTKLDPCTQYDTFTVKFKSESLSQSFSGEKKETFRWVFVIPQGSHTIYESFINLLAGANPSVGSV